MIEKSHDKEGFLSRWSRRKNTPSTELEQGELSSDTDRVTDVEKKPITPLREPLEPNLTQETLEQDETDLPIWQQPSASADEKKAALRALFKQPEFNQIDRLNDYDQDFSQYTSLKGVVTAQMKRMILLAEQKTRPDEQPDTLKSSPDNSESDSTQNDVTTPSDNDEDTPLA
jgi:hypothetical protein